MRAFYMVLFAIILSSAVDCLKYDFDWTEVDKNLTMFGDTSFGDDNKSAESVILESLTTTKNIFGNSIVKTAVQSAAIGTALIPVVGTLATMVASFVGLLESESDWKDKFTHILMDEVDKKIEKSEASFNLQKMQYVLKSIQARIPRLNKTVTGERKITCENIGFATNIFSDLDVIVKSFASSDSIYRRHPLIGAPFLSGLSTLVVLVEPILRILLEEASRCKLSCQIHDAIFDLMDYLLSARFAVTNLNLWKTKQARLLPYNKDGYTISKQLNCEDCSSEAKENGLCIIDDFNLNTYSTIQWLQPCEQTYIRHLRGLMEARFPLELLKELCDRPRGHLTGFGYLTINTKNTYIEERLAEYGDVFYIAIAFNGTKYVPKHESAGSTTVYNKRIFKNSTIIKFLPEGRGMNTRWKISPLLKTVEELLTYTDHMFEHCYKDRNLSRRNRTGEICIPFASIKIDTIWVDERDDNSCDDDFDY